MPTILPTKTPPTTLGQMRRHCIVVFLIGTHAPSSCYQAHCGDSPSGYWIRPPLIMSLSFAHLWQQHETSDMDVILLAPAPSGESDSDSDQHEQQADSGTPGTVELMSFPAHRTLLSNSAVLWCRVLRWLDSDPDTRAAKRARYTSGHDSTEQPTRARLELELQDASEQEAALAVLSSLYAVKPLPRLLSVLSQEQQLQAAVLADKWQVPNVSSAAAQLLVAAANTPGALAETVQHSVLAAAALPDCLQPLQQRVLSLLCDLEAVWADAGLRARLLGLPLHTMELLLASSELKVASEDTILYTAQQYVDQLGGEQQAHAKQRLAPLIRCPHLSRYWLAASVNSGKADTMLLADLRPHLRRLLMLVEARPGYTVDSTDLRVDDAPGVLLPGAPASWALGRRASKPIASVQVEWQLDVSALRDAARCSAAEQQTTSLLCPNSSPPFGGISFTMKMYCTYEDGGVNFRLYDRPITLPDDIYYLCKYAVEVKGFASFPAGALSPKPLPGRGMRGVGDVFLLGCLAGGWDEAAWARKGLPSSGHLTIKLTVSDLPHAPVPYAARGRGRGRGRGRW